MTIPLSTVHEAAFWDEWVCLDCGAKFDPPEGAEPPQECPTCESTMTFPAITIQQVYEALDDSEEPDEHTEGIGQNAGK